MLTLFRRIREKLIASGSLTKYLLYAIGEILLVVIGILIALQVNNWNEQRKLADKEEQLLTQLKEDIEMLLNELETDIAFTQQKIEWTDSLLFHQKNEDAEDWQSLFDKNYMSTAQVFPSRASYENIKSIGLEVISNPELRNKITDLYERSLTRATEWESYVYLYEDRMLALIEKEFTFVRIDEESSEAIFMPESYEAFKSNKELYNGLIHYQERRKFSLLRYRDVQAIAEEIHSNLNLELGFSE